MLGSEDQLQETIQFMQCLADMLDLLFDRHAHPVEVAPDSRKAFSVRNEVRNEFGCARVVQKILA